MENNTITK